MTGRRPLRRVVRVGFTLGLLVGIGAGVARVLSRRAAPGETSGSATWPPLSDVAVAPGPEPSPVRVPGEDETPPATGETWVAPTGGVCPASHPVKAKRATGIFHVPGGAFYTRTVADRCYQDELSAEADGLRRAKR